MLVSVQSCFNSRNTRYYNNVMATADHVTVESIRHLQPVKFGPLTVTAPDDLEGFCVTTIQPCIDLQKKSRKK